MVHEDGVVYNLAMLPPLRKPTNSYVLCRVYAVVGVLAFWALIGCGMYGMWHEEGRYVLLLIPAALLGFPAILLTLNLAAFPWPWSAFGPYIRQSRNAEDALSVLRRSWAQIGRLRASIPMVTWSFFRDGIGIHVVTLGSAFLPAENITIVERTWTGHYRLHHRCQELRSPVTMPDAAYSTFVSVAEEQYRQYLTSR